MIDLENSDPVALITASARDFMANGGCDAETAIATVGLVAALAVAECEFEHGPNERSAALGDVVLDLAQEGPIYQHVLETLTAEFTES